MTRLICALIALFLPIALAWLGLTKALGAHIWWDIKTILIGAPIGVALSLLLADQWPNWTKRLILWALLLIATFSIAKYGQTTFANSYGDDKLAGQFWYFGWIATGAATGGLIYSVLRR